MREGGLEAPTRYPYSWREREFSDPEKLDQELRRVFDICHTCRRCFRLCDSFPRLFDLIDDSETGKLDSVASADFKSVVDGCTLCDMCFMVSFPYVPPHEWNLDFPHFMVRYRALERGQAKAGYFARQVSETDRNGRLGCRLSGVVNWATDTANTLTRPVMEGVAGIDREAYLPAYDSKTLLRQLAEVAVPKALLAEILRRSVTCDRPPCRHDEASVQNHLQDPMRKLCRAHVELRPNSTRIEFQRSFKPKSTQQAQEIAMQCPDQQPNGLTQLNLLSLPARSRHYLGNVG